MMIPVTDLYKYILIDIAGISNSVVTQEIRNALVDFFVDSKIWREDVTAINVVSGTSTYPLATSDPAEIRIVDIMTVRLSTEDKPLTPATEIQLDNEYVDWRTTGTGPPQFYLSVVDRTTIQLVKTPNTSITAGLLVNIAICPTRAAETSPDWMLERWVDAITHRAKHRCYLMAKKPWSNVGLATYHKEQYEHLVGIGDIEAGQGFNRSRMRSTAYYR